VKVGDLAQLLIGKKIVQHQPARIARIARAKLQPGGAARMGSGQLDAQFLGQLDQLPADLDDGYGGGGKAEARCQASSEQLVHQNAEVLRVILEFNDVVVAVRAPHEVRLRASAHPPYVLDGSQHTRLS